ncbi:hypothetical protein GL325_14950 [Aeromicrobium sp. 636]|uniref:Uncharacterized protein n=1 Tax=Aeromicrobium senzhongii TaxID=2663859 RepID=A0A8I0EWM2_9ACTN|nr:MULTISPECIES: hypothetical protein [Aeromicrobium]MBC9227625.1 hypothetical protein [Aeromicrobium senzhongii]MCQ3999722.1 hypothetical protein [Aeromicrobium sp. 636]
MEHLFFGYAESDSNARECLQRVSTRVADFASVAQSVTWEDLRVDGKLIINDILDAIAKCTIGVFDVTSLNNNVLFELGVAIGSGKRVVITREADNQTADRIFREFALLTTTGFTGYINSDQLVSSMTELIASPPPPLLDSLLGEVDNPVVADQLLYVPSMREDESSRELSRLVERHESLQVFRLELDEHGTSPLAWLTQQIYNSPFALFHLTPPEAYLSETSNRRCALLSGIALGMSHQIRLVMHSKVAVAMDYRDLRIAFTNSRNLVDRAETWLTGLKFERNVSKRVRKHLPAELAALRFGNHVAEADASGLETYFVETRDFLDVMEGTATIFTGRKGTGKTASMLRAASELQEDARNLVCVIKPASYELEALCDLLGKIRVSHIGSYLIEGIWKYLLYTEVAGALIRHVESTPAGVLAGSPIDDVRKALEEVHQGHNASFSKRLEDLLRNLDVHFDQLVEQSGIDETRQAIGRALYGGHISRLRSLLASALADKRRVAVLIDNLDKAWERGADLETMSSVIFGLLTAVGRVSEEFSRESGKDDKKLRFTLTAFLRSDIYAYVRTQAREPDKINASEIEWRDADLLSRVLEDRFIASRNGKSAALDLWTEYFAPEIRGVDSRRYILSRVQPRPRDLIFFANAAVLAATNARNHLIGVTDVDKAETAYSQFAYEALLVEGVAVGIDMEELLMSFVGENSRLSEGELRDVMEEGGLPREAHAEYIRILRQHGFLGLQVAPGSFDYGGTPGEMQKAHILATKFQKTAGGPRLYEVHPAYRRHLLVEERT